MIVKTGSGFQVRSENGSKNLSRPDLKREEALKRLRQIEFFKHRGKP